MPSERDRRAIVLGVAVVASAVAVTRGVPAWRAWRAAVLGAAAQTHAEYARAIADVRDARATMDSAQARAAQLGDVIPGLLHGAEPAAAGAALAEAVSETAAESGVRTGALDVQVDSARAGAFLTVRVRTEGVGDVRGVTDWLVALATRRERLAVRDFGVTQTEPASVARAEALHVSIVVEALARRPVSPSREPTPAATQRQVVVPAARAARAP